MKKIVFILMAALIAASCATVKPVVYTVASQKAECVGEVPMMCMLVKKGDAAEWEYFYSQIEGFNHEEGYEYVLEVKEEAVENVPADASAIRYVLVKEVSKTKKTSENLPQPKVAELPSYECVGKVVAVTSQDIGKGAAAGQVPVTVVEVKVTSSQNEDVKAGDVIYCELTATPNVKPVVGREYVFKAAHKHPSHAKGMYLLETDVLDLTR